MYLGKKHKKGGGGNIDPRTLVKIYVKGKKRKRKAPSFFRGEKKGGKGRGCTLLLR